MTVQELIDQLNNIEDKSLSVAIRLDILGYDDTYEEYGVVESIREERIRRLGWDDKRYVVIRGWE